MFQSSIVKWNGTHATVFKVWFRHFCIYALIKPKLYKGKTSAVNYKKLNNPNSNCNKSVVSFEAAAVTLPVNNLNNV